jgi:hypothetical protein
MVVAGAGDFVAGYGAVGAASPGFTGLLCVRVSAGMDVGGVGLAAEGSLRGWRSGVWRCERLFGIWIYEPAGLPWCNTIRSGRGISSILRSFLTLRGRLRMRFQNAMWPLAVIQGHARGFRESWRGCIWNRVVWWLE